MPEHANNAATSPIHRSRSRLTHYSRIRVRANTKNMPEGVTRYNNVDPSGMVFETADLTNRLPRPNLRYPVIDPQTGTTYEPPDNGWTVNKGLMEDWVSRGLIAFGKRPRKKKDLRDYAFEMPLPTFFHSRNTANAHLERVLGEKRFRSRRITRSWRGGSA